MRPMMAVLRIALPVFVASASAALLAACDAEICIGWGCSTTPAEIIETCICEGDPGRPGEPCSSEPTDGHLRLFVGCTQGQASRALSSTTTGGPYLPFCVYRVWTSDSSIVDVFPPQFEDAALQSNELTILDTPRGDHATWFLQTKATLPSGQSRAEVELYYTRCIDKDCTSTGPRVTHRKVVVSNSCS